MSEEQQGQEWVFIGLDEKVARKQGMPFRIPVPREEFEGLADKGLSPETVRGWIGTFLAESEMGKDGNWRRRNAQLVSQLEGFVDKFPLWDKAQKLFGAGDFEAALKTLKRVTIMCPDDHAAGLNYANALANQGDYDKASKQLKQVRDSFADEPDYHVTVAQVQVMRGEQDAAIESLLAALELQGDHRGAMDALARMGVLTKLYEEPRNAASLTYVRTDSVLSYLEELWGTAERSVEYYREQMGYHLSERRPQVALAAAERAIALASGSPDEKAELGRARALRALGSADEALAALDAFIARVPRSAEAHVERAGCLHALGRNAEIGAAIDQALLGDPGDQLALSFKFWPKDQNDIEKVQAALPAIEKWADDHPAVAGAWRSLARAKLVVGAPDALALFGKAVALAPDDDDLRSEWWGELAKSERFQEIIDDSRALGDMAGRSWQLRWNEAEAYRALGRVMEARGCFMQVNADESLHVDIRRRAKRAAMDVGGGPPPTSEPG